MAWVTCALRGRRNIGTLLLINFALFYAVQARDYYDILKLSKGATDSQIKRAYRKLALIYHPDKVKGSAKDKEAGSKKFADISHAYEVLSDAEKRKIYDRHGEEGLKQHQAGGGGGGGQDIFSQFFGGFGGFGGQQEEESTPKGNDVVVELEVSLKDLYLGNHFDVVRDKSVIKPAPGKRQCNCRNKMVTKQVGPGMFQQYAMQECEECPNVKLVRDVESLSVAVEPGMKDGQEIVFFEQGEPLIDGDTGDLKFVVKAAKDPRFERRGADLHYNATISLVDALVGFSMQIEHLDGHLVELGRPLAASKTAGGVTRPGQVQVIKGQGMPVYESRHVGDLYVTYSVAFPVSLTEKQKTIVRETFPPGTALHEEL